ncbi:MAG: DUF488 family protein [Candidatus Polarisedimenticolia bacterium]
MGHSTRSLDELVALLEWAGVTVVADVRTLPRSRRHPHFSGDALAASLPPRGIDYVHIPALGGLRKPRRDSINTAWKNAGFRGYADHMQTPEFEAGLGILLAGARDGVVAVMCAEALPWKCHRTLLSDALAARGVEVRHVMGSPGRPRLEPHELTAWARVKDGRVTYPGLG